MTIISVFSTWLVLASLTQLCLLILCIWQIVYYH